MPANAPSFPPSVSDTEGESPEFVRMSWASALVLRFRSGQFARRFDFGGINLLLNYGDGCRSDCAYCGLARSRPGGFSGKSFIRVEWPLLPTQRVVDRMAQSEGRLTRLCISMVTHPRAYEDTLEIVRTVRARVRTPLSVLLAPPTVNADRLRALKEAGVDMVGVGLDAVTEPLFDHLRTSVPSGSGLRWRNYQETLDAARAVFGPGKVNCHVLVGIGETDRELVETLISLRDREIQAYLFSFHPETESRLGALPPPSLERWRRIQLVKALVDRRATDPDTLEFDDTGRLSALHLPGDVVESLVRSGEPFLTNGCPASSGEPGCTRPYGSYRASEPVRDFPFLPDMDDLAAIREELALPELLGSAPQRQRGPTPARSVLETSRSVPVGPQP